jgi:hypothetical protein
LPKALIELITNKNIYYNSPIYGKDVKNVEVPSYIQKILSLIPKSVLKGIGFGVDEKTGNLSINPAIDYLLKLLPQYALAQRGFAGTENSPFQNLSALTGLKFFPYNSEKNKESYYKNFTTNINAEINKQYPQGGEITMQDMKTAYTQIYSDYMAQKYNIAGADKIKEITNYTGSNKEINLILKLINKPYDDAMDKIKGKSLTELAKILSDLGINPTMKDISKILNQLKVKS